MSVFTVLMANQTIAGASTLVIIRASATSSTRGGFLRVVRAWCSQEANESSEQLGVAIGRKASVFGTYVAATPEPHAIGTGASAIVGGTANASGTCGVDATAEGAGTFTPIIEEGFNNLNGWLWVPVPEERILIPADQTFALKLITAPTNLNNWTAGVTFDELN